MQVEEFYFQKCMNNKQLVSQTYTKSNYLQVSDAKFNYSQSKNLQNSQLAQVIRLGNTKFSYSQSVRNAKQLANSELTNQLIIHKA